MHFTANVLRVNNPGCAAHSITWRLTRCVTLIYVQQCQCNSWTVSAATGLSFNGPWPNYPTCQATHQHVSHGFNTRFTLPATMTSTTSVCPESFAQSLTKPRRACRRTNKERGKITKLVRLQVSPPGLCVPHKGWQQPQTESRKLAGVHNVYFSATYNAL